MNASGRYRFYRVVRTNPPTLTDFLSNAEKGIEPLRPLPPAQARLWTGVSCTETLAQARARACASSHLGAFIAALSLPDDARVRVERTGQRAGHFTVWSDANFLLSLVEAVFPVVPEGDES